MSYVFCRLVRSLGPKIGLVDNPGYRKIHDHSMPTGGGLGIWLALILPFFFCGLAIWLSGDWIIAQCERLLNSATLEGGKSFGITMAEFVKTHLPGVAFKSRRLFILLGLGSVLVILGTLDDRFGLSWKIRLLVQFIVAGIAVALGWKATFFVDLPWLTSLVSVIWIVALINSFNMMDNMDGLSGGVALICSVFLAIVMFFFARNPESGEAQFFWGGFLLALSGSIAGFLILNRPPATIFMGDGGAYFIGFLLAVMTLAATFTGGENPKQAIFVPLCILAVPLYDLVSVVLIRLAAGKSPFEGDKNHYSHRLVRLGLSKTGAVLTIYLTTVICSISALFLYQVNMISACLILLQILMILGLVCILEFHGIHKNNDKK